MPACFPGIALALKCVWIAGAELDATLGFIGPGRAAGAELDAASGASVGASSADSSSPSASSAHAHAGRAAPAGSGGAAPSIFLDCSTGDEQAPAGMFPSRCGRRDAEMLPGLARVERGAETPPLRSAGWSAVDSTAHRLLTSAWCSGTPE